MKKNFVLYLMGFCILVQFVFILNLKDQLDREIYEREMYVSRLSEDIYDIENLSLKYCKLLDQAHYYTRKKLNTLFYYLDLKYEKIDQGENYFIVPKGTEK